MSSEICSPRRSSIVAQGFARAGRTLSIDICPWANRWVYWLRNPFWVLTVAVVGSAACGVFLNPWIFALTALLVTVVGAGTVLPWIAMRGVECLVMFDVRRVRFGEPALVRLRIRNRWPLPVWGLSLINGFAASDLFEDSQRPNDSQLTDGRDGIAFARVPGWSTMEYTWPFVAKRRGQYPINGMAEVETSFPFGLFRARRPAQVEGQLTVWPATTSLVGLPDTAESQMCDDAFSERRVGEFGDMLGTRTFREGDSLRRVHWAQTARQQTLIVTEHQAPLTTSVRIVLELPSDSQAFAGRNKPSLPVHGMLSGEQCIRVAASLCDSLHRQHCRVELQVGDRLFAVGDSQAGLQRAMDALATLNVDNSALAENGCTSKYQTATTRASGGGRGSEFAITVTTPQNARPDRRRQIVVTDETFGDAVTIGNAWIQLHATQPLSELATVWRKACHD